MTSRHIRPALLAGLVAITAACARDGGGGDVRQDSAAVDATATRAGADAPRFDALPDSLGFDDDPRAAPVPGDWTETTTLTEPAFRIEVPRTVRTGHRSEEERGYRLGLDSFPGCRWSCGLDVTVHTAAAPLDLGAVEREMAAAAADTTLDMAPGPPERITIGSEPALKVEATCGDCTAVEYVLVRGRTGVTLRVDLDSRIPVDEMRALLPRFDRAVSTFRWADSIAVQPPPTQ